MTQDIPLEKDDPYMVTENSELIGAYTGRIREINPGFNRVIEIELLLPKFPASIDSSKAEFEDKFPSKPTLEFPIFGARQMQSFADGHDVESGVTPFTRHRYQESNCKPDTEIS
jgi:hypothetical protein